MRHGGIEMKDETCIICGKHQTAGLVIQGDVICPRCEQNIVSTDASDAQYASYIEKLLTVAKKAVHA
jgi:uncharacterized Zn finger protein (UPF0148 family)